MTAEDFADALADAGHTLGAVTVGNDGATTVTLELSNGRRINIFYADGDLRIEEVRHR